MTNDELLNKVYDEIIGLLDEDHRMLVESRGPFDGKASGMLRAIYLVKEWFTDNINLGGDVVLSNEKDALIEQLRSDLGEGWSEWLAVKDEYQIGCSPKEYLDKLTAVIGNLESDLTRAERWRDTYNDLRAQYGIHGSLRDFLDETARGIDSLNAELSANAETIQSLHEDYDASKAQVHYLRSVTIEGLNRQILELQGTKSKNENTIGAMERNVERLTKELREQGKDNATSLRTIENLQRFNGDQIRRQIVKDIQTRLTRRMESVCNPMFESSKAESAAKYSILAAVHYELGEWLTKIGGEQASEDHADGASGSGGTTPPATPSTQ